MVKNTLEFFVLSWNTKQKTEHIFSLLYISVYGRVSLLITIVACCISCISLTQSLKFWMLVTFNISCIHPANAYSLEERWNGPGILWFLKPQINDSLIDRPYCKNLCISHVLCILHSCLNVPLSRTEARQVVLIFAFVFFLSLCLYLIHWGLREDSEPTEVNIMYSSCLSS